MYGQNMARRSTDLGERVIVPPLERWKRGEVERPAEHAIADSDGRPGSPFRAIDTLMAMFRNKTITAEMYAAGTEFHDDFVMAGFEPMRAADMGRMSGGVWRDKVPFKLGAARDRVHEAVVALGGSNSPAGCCIWYVIGLQYSIREWCIREGWGGHPIRPHTAKGILLSGLGVLQAHYGY